MKDQKTYTWHKLPVTRGELKASQNCLASIQVNGKQLCIAVFNESLFACAAKCPHASGPMAEGYVDALGNIVCPIHRYKFNLQNGRNISGEGYYLKTWPVEEREDGLYIGM